MANRISPEYQSASPRGLNRVIRERDLYAFTGLRRTQIAALITRRISQTDQARRWRSRQGLG